MPTLNIQVFVDVIALLSGAPSNKAVHMFDDGGMGSEGQGTHTLVSAVLPGQLVRWTVNAVDVQTQVWLKDVTFGPAVERTVSEVAEVQSTTDESDTDTWQQKSEAPNPWPETAAGPVPIWGKRFEGYIPFEILPEMPHVYHLKLAFAQGNGPAVTVEGPALRFALPQVAEANYSAVPQLL
jgi:hypothetical protein